MVALLPASAALGHASSMLPHARLSSEGRQMFVEWTAAGDDVADIGVGLGLLPPEAALAFQGIGDAYPSTAQETRFARSDELESYLLDNLRVIQQGQPCRTYSIDGSIWDAMHTVDDPEHLWDATLLADDTRSSGQPLLFTGMAVALVGGGSVLWWMRPARSRTRVGS
jgi:hypothetical protein